MEPDERHSTFVVELTGFPDLCIETLGISPFSFALKSGAIYSCLVRVRLVALDPVVLPCTRIVDFLGLPCSASTSVSSLKPFVATHANPPLTSYFRPMSFSAGRWAVLALSANALPRYDVAWNAQLWMDPS